ATNLVSGIANAYLDSTPIVAITGNVGRSLIGRDSFQEVDIKGITMPITKHNFQVQSTEELADVVRKAFQIARSGRPGPVLIDIPKDIQIATAEYTPAAPLPSDKAPYAFETDINQAIKMISESKKPYVYCGGGIINAAAGREIAALADAIGAPIGFSMMGLSAVPTTHPRALGMVGMHGHYAATKAMYESDLILALGIRFSDRATGDKSKFATGAKIIHIDIDNAELNKNISCHLGINADVKETVSRILEGLAPTAHPEWAEQVASFRKYEEENLYLGKGELTPYQIIDAVMEHTAPEMPIATDVGQHQMWAAQRCKLEAPRTFVSSGGLGTMGYGMGAAIGACVATGKRTVLFTGDGSFGMNLNEMATAVSQNLPLVVMLMNNGVLGMVRQWQTLFFGQRYSQTTLDRKTDFVALAKAFGAEGYSVTNKDELDAALDAAFAADGPVLLDCRIDQDEMVMPMIPPNGSITDILVNLKN
ncbi:MAG: biosynthetic-type acetolactate synthase large subunit, partial [Clostridia bacterium]|nr:biosynthetic-type acetolactate synthase large subunit [Clostridia bacterium]